LATEGTEAEENTEDRKTEGGRQKETKGKKNGWRKINRKEHKDHRDRSFEFYAFFAVNMV